MHYNWPLERYVELRVAHAPGTFSPPLRVCDPDMYHDTCVTHVPWCMPGSLTSGFLWIRLRGKRSRHSRRMRNLQFYLSGKRSMAYPILGHGWVLVHLRLRRRCLLICALISSSNRKYPPFPLLSYFSVVVCLRCLLHYILLLIAYIFRENREFVFIIVQFMMSANNWIRFVLKIVFVALYITPSHYHHCANLSEDIGLMKCLSDIFCRVCE